MKHLSTFFCLLAFAFAGHAQEKVTKERLLSQPNNAMIRSLLQKQQRPATASKTTTGVTRQRLVAQVKRSYPFAIVEDSLNLTYSIVHGSTFDLNDMLFPVNYTYAAAPMFTYAGVFTTPQVLYDTCIHWTLNPFTMPIYTLYEGMYATYNTSNELTHYVHLYSDSVTNRNVSFDNDFNSDKSINSGLWYNLHAGVEDTAFKQYFSYNSTGQLIQDSVYELHLGVWRLAGNTYYSYGTDGNLSLIDHWANVTDTSFLLPLVEQLKYVNTWDASDRLTSVETHMYNGTSIGPYVRDTFAYTGTYAMHTDWKQYQFDAIHGTWWPISRVQKTLTAGLPDTVTYNGWDSIASVWTPSSMDIPYFNSYGNPDSMYTYLYNWTSFSTSADYITKYYYETYDDTTGTSTPTATPVVTKENGFHLYPNPSSDIVHVQLDAASSGFELEMHNLAGQLVLRQRSPNTNCVIDMRSFCNGVYVLTISDNKNQTSKAVQIVKQ